MGQHRFVYRITGAYHALHLRQRIEKSLFLARRARVGQNDFMLRAYALQLRGRQLPIHQHLFAAHA